MIIDRNPVWKIHHKSLIIQYIMIFFQSPVLKDISQDKPIAEWEQIASPCVIKPNSVNRK